MKLTEYWKNSDLKAYRKTNKLYPEIVRRYSEHMGDDDASDEK